jgi:hypothetical protein
MKKRALNTANACAVREGGPASQSSGGGHAAWAAVLAGMAVLAACGGSKTDARYPPRADGCDVKVFRGKVAGITYDDIGHVDAICGNDLGPEECLKELKNQTCKLGGDIVYDVPDEPLKPSPDKMRYTGSGAHTRGAGGSGKTQPH